MTAVHDRHVTLFDGPTGGFVAGAGRFPGAGQSSTACILPVQIQPMLMGPIDAWWRLETCGYLRRFGVSGLPPPMMIWLLPMILPAFPGAAPPEKGRILYSHVSESS